jgi:hypothetical protein
VMSGGTTILPRTDDTAASAARGLVPAAGIVPRTGGRRSLRDLLPGRPSRTGGQPALRDLLAGRRRLVLSAAAAVVVVGAGGMLLAATRDGNPTGTEAALAAPATAGPEQPSCEVRYALRRDSGRAFDADLTVVNAGAVPVTDWSLAFTFPGDQKLTRAASATVEQKGSTVVLRPAGGSAAVPAGGSAGMRLTGSYARSNAFPVEFRLDGAFCVPKLSTATTTTTTPPRSTGTTAAKEPASGHQPAPPAKPKDDSSGKGPGPKKDKPKGGGPGKG